MDSGDRGTRRRHGPRRGRHAPHQVGPEHDRLEAPRGSSSPHHRRVGGRVRALPAAPGMAAAPIHDARRLQIHLLLGVGPPHAGPDGRPGLRGAVGLLRRAGEDPPRLSRADGRPLRPGRDAGVGRVVDGQVGIGRRSTRRSARDSGQPVPFGGPSGHGGGNVRDVGVHWVGNTVDPPRCCCCNVGIEQIATVGTRYVVVGHGARPQASGGGRRSYRPYLRHHPIRRLRGRERRRQCLQHLPQDERSVDSS
mmetsp:Transcript_17835/g.51056  ORF Transcript_17835/g.51056 Transcript_17835/m.51056 type:complete len:251 (-) Transcript_17835:85-837(-)